MSIKGKAPLGLDYHRNHTAPFALCNETAYTEEILHETETSESRIFCRV